MSKLRSVAAVLLLVTTVGVSAAYADESPHRTASDRSAVRQFLVWIMDQLTSPPG